MKSIFLMLPLYLLAPALLMAEGGQGTAKASSGNAHRTGSHSRKGLTRLGGKTAAKGRTRIPWTLGTFPNPQVNLDLCGRGGKASHICDPENLLNPSLLDFEDVELNGLQNHRTGQEHESPSATEIASGPWRGSARPSRPANALAIHNALPSKCEEQGFLVYVAVVDQIDREYMSAYYGLEEAAREFGWALGNRWGVLKTPCRNGVMVLYVVADQYMVILPDAGGASAILPEELCRHVAYGATKALHVYPDEILSRALANLKAIFEGSYDNHRLQYDRTIVFLYVLSGCFGLVFVLLSVCGLYDGASRWRHLSRYRACRAKIQTVHEAFQQQGEDLALCPICIGKLPQVAESSKSRHDVSFICGHRFHASCCESWSHRFCVNNHCVHNPNNVGRCPVCNHTPSSAVAHQNMECEVKKFMLRSLREEYPEIISEHHLERWSSCHTEIWLAELCVPRYLSIWHQKE